MSTRDDFEELMRAWIDQERTPLPERYLLDALAEVDTTGQRGPVRARVEDMIARIQPLVLPAAAVIIISAVALWTVAGGPDHFGNDRASPSPTVRSTPVATPQPASPAPDAHHRDLEQLTYGGTEIVMGVDHRRSIDAIDALRTVWPDLDPEVDTAGLVAARYDEFDGPVGHDTRNMAVIGTFASRWSSPQDAARAYAALIAALDSADGWDLEPRSTAEQLGNEAVSYQGTAYGRGEVTLLAWRSDDLVLMAIGLEGTDPIQPIQIARRMDAQLR